MTPYQLAKAECANLVEGGCLFNGPSRKEGDCALKHPGMRCAYFEKSVLPLGKQVPRYARVPKMYWAAIARHAGINAVALGRVDAVRVCECGEPREKGHRFCPRCAARRRKEAARRRKAKQRACCVTVL